MLGKLMYIRQIYAASNLCGKNKYLDVLGQHTSTDIQTKLCTKPELYL